MYKNGWKYNSEHGKQQYRVELKNYINRLDTFCLNVKKFFYFDK